MRETTVPSRLIDSTTRGPRLLSGGSWGAVPPGWQLYMAVCAAGVVSLVVSSVRSLTRRRPAQVVANHSRVVDVAAELGGRPLGNGPFRWLASFPGNEVFEIELATRDVRLPRFPAEWDGLSILHLSDWHLIGTIDRPYFEHASLLAEEMRADLILASDPDADRLGAEVRDPRGEYVYVSGNRLGAILTDFALRSRARRGRLNDASYVVTTLVTTPLIRRIGESRGVRVIDDLLVGFKYIAQTIDRESRRHSDPRRRGGL